MASFAVQPKKGMKQQGKKGKYKQKEGGRQRTPWSGTLKRIRRILRGQLTPAQAISSIFSSPSMMMASVFLEANPKDLAMPCLSDEFRQRMDQQYLDSTQTFRLYQPPARPLESAPDNLIASTHQDYLLAN
ncbi:hypothetical protein IV102_32025 [bacterium]|nr:hypothetical protein [bacterium]